MEELHGGRRRRVHPAGAGGNGDEEQRAVETPFAHEVGDGPLRAAPGRGRRVQPGVHADRLHRRASGSGFDARRGRGRGQELRPLQPGRDSCEVHGRTRPEHDGDQRGEDRGAAADAPQHVHHHRGQQQARRHGGAVLQQVRRRGVHGAGVCDLAVEADRGAHHEEGEGSRQERDGEPAPAPPPPTRDPPHQHTRHVPVQRGHQDEDRLHDGIARQQGRQKHHRRREERPDRPGCGPVHPRPADGAGFGAGFDAAFDAGFSAGFSAGWGLEDAHRVPPATGTSPSVRRGEGRAEPC
ncbi:hypothetical protein GCM10027519_02570 [Kineococcus endophyticus]